MMYFQWVQLNWRVKLLGLGLEQRAKGKGSSQVFLLLLMSAFSLGGMPELALGNSPSQLQTQGSSHLAQSGAPAKSGGIEPSTLEGRLDSNSRTQKNDKSYYNVHTFEGRAGEQITIDLTSSEFDSYLILLDPEGKKIAENDDGGSGNNSRIIVTLPTNGTYRIIANAHKAGETGNYTLSWREATSDDLALAEAGKLMQQAIQLKDQGQYTAAIPLVERALAIREKVLGKEHPDVAASLNNLAGLYKDIGNYSQAEPLYQRSLAIWEKVLGKEHPLVATSLNNLATLYHAQENYNQAEPLYLRSLAIREKVLGKEHPDVAASLNNLANLYQDMGNYSQAEPLYQRALAINKKVLGKEHPDVAASLSNLASLYQEMGNYSQAEPLYQHSLAIGEKVLGKEHPDVATRLNNLAGLYKDMGNYSQAEFLLQRSLTIWEKALGKEHHNVAVSLNNLAALYQETGNYSQAEPLHQRSLAIREKVLGKEHPDVASSLNNLAELYREQGNYSQAEPLYQRSLAIQEKVLGKEHPDVAQSLNNLAALYQTMGNYSQAEPVYQRSLAIREKLLGKEHPLVATSLSNLASLYQAIGNYSQAEPVYQRSLAIREKVLGIEHPDVAQSLNNLANLYSEMGNYSQAEPIYQRSLVIREKVLGKEHPLVASSLNNLAELYRAQGNYSQTEPLYQRSLAIQEKMLGKEHPLIAITLRNLAFLYQAQGDIARTLEFLNRSTNIEERNLALTLTIGSEAQKSDYIATLSGTTNATVSLHIQGTLNNSQAVRLAFTTVLQRKGRVLDALTDSLQTLRQNLKPEDQKLLDELAANRSQMAALIFNKPENLPLEQYRKQVAILKTTADQLEADLSRRSAQFRTQSQPVTIEAVQQLIPANAALVELVLYYPFNLKTTKPDEKWGTPRYAAYVLHHSGDLKWIDLGEAEPINQAVTDFRSALQSPSSDIQPVARALDEKLMQPIRKLLGDTRSILLSPDSQLNLIPFAALVDENNNYLIKNYSISYLTSGRDLLKLQTDAPSRQAPVLLANPDYANPGNPQTVQIASTKASTAGATTRGSDARRSVDFAQLTFTPLEGTKLEADTIAPLLPNVTVLTQSQATENALKQLQAPSILHIATHGFFLQDVECIPASDTRGGAFSTPATIVPEYVGDRKQVCRPTPRNTENPLLRSGLALAGFNPRSSGAEDGVLTALEAAGLNLYGTRLVVLSACETGLGDVNNGEGVYGLRRAFVTAGAESQLMSLWKVDDYGTSELMSLYYQRLRKGEGRSEALRQVQLEMMQAPAYQHPYYWASFIFSGDWSSVKAW
jgi:CHAT domain-containing protein/lipopolysaccharide biosynthesis regulator YciM